MEFRHGSLEEIVSACREQTLRYLRHEPSIDGFCFELLRRALCNRDDRAWQAVLSQYSPSVLAWVRHHPAAASVSEDDQYWVNRTFERLWSAIGADRFGHFEGLPSLLRYLKLCAFSVLQDAVRSNSANRQSYLDDDVADTVAAPDVERATVGRLTASELWRTVDGVLQDETERAVAHLSFVLDFQPREIYERHRDHFASVADVYRVKRNILDRLRRNPDVRAYLA